MIRPPPISTRTVTLFPVTTLFRSFLNGAAGENNPKRWSGHNNYDAMCSVARAAADCAEQALNSARPFAVETMGSRILDGVYEERSHPFLTVEQQIGRASCRERVCQYV